MALSPTPEGVDKLLWWKVHPRSDVGAVAIQTAKERYRVNSLVSQWQFRMVDRANNVIASSGIPISILCSPRLALSTTPTNWSESVDYYGVLWSPGFSQANE